MASYEVAVWLRHAMDEPAIVTTVEADSAAEAMVRVLRSRGLPGATQVNRASSNTLCEFIISPIPHFRLDGL